MSVNKDERQVRCFLSVWTLIYRFHIGITL